MLNKHCVFPQSFNSTILHQQFQINHSLFSDAQSTADNRERFDSILTLFVSADLCKQKLHLLDSIGPLVNWRICNFANLIGRELKQFMIETIRDEQTGQFLNYVVNFRQLQTYSLDDVKNRKELQLRDLVLPLGFEHEFVSRNVSFLEKKFKLNFIK